MHISSGGLAIIFKTWGQMECWLVVSSGQSPKGLKGERPVCLGSWILHVVRILVLSVIYFNRIPLLSVVFVCMG